MSKLYPAALFFVCLLLGGFLSRVMFRNGVEYFDICVYVACIVILFLILIGYTYGVNTL